jgi:hypothetical protein
MRTRTLAVLIGLAAALAACSPKAGDKEAAPAPTARNAIEPGSWRYTIKYSQLQLDGMPKGALSGPSEVMVPESCLTEKDTNFSSFVEDNSIGEQAADMDCTTVRMNTAGGKIDGLRTCTSKGGTLNVAMTGTYAPNRVDMMIDMQGDAGMGNIHQTMQVLSERVGPCPPLGK